MPWRVLGLHRGMWLLFYLLRSHRWTLRAYDRHEIYLWDSREVYGLLHRSDVLLDLLDKDIKDIIDLWGVKKMRSILRIRALLENEEAMPICCQCLGCNYCFDLWERCIDILDSK